MSAGAEAEPGCRVSASPEQARGRDRANRHSGVKSGLGFGDAHLSCLSAESRVLRCVPGVRCQVASQDRVPTVTRGRLPLGQGGSHWRWSLLCRVR